MTEYLWDCTLACGHTLVVEKVVPGPPGSPQRCFHDDHHGIAAQIQEITTARLRTAR